jgi:hypothetical protein
MSTRRLTTTIALVVLMAAFPFRAARAQVEAIRLTYDAYAGCPSEAQFVGDVTARTDRARRVGADEPARAFDVRVRAEDGESRGVLQITSLDGTVSLRDVTGETCAAVVSALALMTALAIDPRAATAIDPPATTGATPQIRSAPDASNVPIEPPARGPSRGGTPSGGSTPRAASAPPPGASDATESETESDSDEPTSPTSRRMRWAVGVDGQTLAGFVPNWGLGGGVFADLASEGSGVFAPSLRASAFAVATNAPFTAGVGSLITWLYARIEACPIRLPLADSLAIRVCAALDAGILRSEGIRLANANTETRPWFAPGALGRAQWALPGDLWVELEGGLSVPLMRYVFNYQDGPSNVVDVSKIRAAGAALDLGVGYHFP